MTPTTITVEPAVLDTAGTATITAFTTTVDAALTALGSSGGMTGTDPAGLVVGESYDDAAADALEATVDAVNGCARIGDLLRMSAENYA